MNHPEIAKIGLGNVDMARLKKSIDILVEANGLPRTPTVEEIFTPRLPAAGDRSAEEAVLRLPPRDAVRATGATSPLRRRELLEEGEGHAEPHIDRHRCCPLPRGERRRAANLGACETRSIMDLKLERPGRGDHRPGQGHGRGHHQAFAAEGCAPRAGRPRHRGDRAGGAGGARRRRRGHRRALRPDRRDAVRARRRSHRRGLRPHRHPGQRRGRLRADRQDRRRDHAGGIRRHRHAQHERLLPHHARRAAGHDGAALRQDRQCRRHLRHARPRRPHGLFGVEMGPARHHQELRARGRPLQHQRQLRRARHGRRPALPRQGLRRHGEAPRHHASRRRSRATPPTTRSSASPIDADVANACLFLASDVSRQITGVDLPVDGGWAML